MFKGNMMGEARKVAVILVRHDISVPSPTIDDCRSILLTGQDSVIRYWQDNTENWFEFPVCDFFGTYNISLPPGPSKRQVVMATARTAAQDAGIDLSGYDTVVVLNCPGTGFYDAGADGIGIGSGAVLGISDTHTFFCHELGHVLGFNHSYGIPNTGGDWSNDGVDQYDPVYGDPYDIMSSASFGAADPTRVLSTPFNGFPASASAGPMLSRAQLHFYHPAALETKHKVHHIFEDGDNEIVTLYPAGSGVDDRAELIVFHPSGEDSGARGRIYVEYRQPFDFNYVSRWDSGLAQSGDERDRRGVIVHVVQDMSGSATPGVWYAGRICFPTPDTDVRVDTVHGSAVVLVSDEFAQQGVPGYVRVRVTRQTRTRVSVAQQEEKAVQVTATERRAIPGWEWAGEFTWERRETTVTARYTPFTGGLGGNSPYDAATTVKVYWYVDNYMLTGDAGTETMLAAGGSKSVHLHYSIDADTKVLTLVNDPADGTFVIPVQASASDPPSWSNPVTANSSYQVDGLSEGWGKDYQDFMDFWDRITHPIPVPDFRPPRPDDYRVESERLGRVFERLQASNPLVAGRLQPLYADQLRHLGRGQFNR
jgi:hypothetical protein